MSSSVVCDYPDSAWERNSRGENPCEVYAQLQGKCDPTFTVSGVNSTLAPAYRTPNNACGCNLVAYNLMGGCSWCQTSRGFRWLTVNQWSASCNATQYNPSYIPTTVSTSDIDIPAWAYVTPTSGTWNPAQASLAASHPTGTPYSEYPSGGYYNYRGSSVSYLLLWVTLGVCGFVLLVGGTMHYQRQTRRRAWYGPTAAYHVAQRGGYVGIYSQPLYAAPGAVRATAHVGYAPPDRPLAGNPRATAHIGYAPPERPLAGNPRNVPSAAPVMANVQPGSTLTAGSQPAGHMTAVAPAASPPESDHQAVPGSPITPGSRPGVLGLSSSTPRLDSAEPLAPSTPIASASKDSETHHAVEEVLSDTNGQPV